MIRAIFKQVCRTQKGGFERTSSNPTGSATELCMLNVSVNGFVPATHLLVPIATQTTREMPPSSSERFTKHVARRSEVCMGVASSSELLFRDILRKPLGHPITTTERNVAGYLIKKMMASSPDDNFLNVPTCVK